MRYFCHIVLIVLPGFIKAQPVFTYSDFAPQSGDQYIVMNSNSYCPGNSGVNQTWNFATASVWGTSTYSVVPTSTIPCGSQFSNATISIGAGGYTNVAFTPSEYLNYGNCATPAMTLWNYSDPDKMFEFPMNYGYSFTDTYEGQNANTPSYRQATANVTYEGYGTVITPNGTYTNAICIHRSVTQADTSTNSSSLCFGDEYYWFAQGYRYPIVQTWYYPSSAQCPSSGSGTMFLQSITIGMGETAAAPSLHVGPNPATDEVTITTSVQVQDGVLTITDLIGRPMKTIPINGHLNTIDLTEFAPGIYIARLNDGAGVRIIKQ